MNTRWKRLSIIVFIFFILVVIAIIYKHYAYGTVTLSEVPSYMAITVDGKAPKSTSLNLSSGKHVIKASGNGFASRTINFSVKGGAKEQVDVYLNTNGAVGLEYLQAHPLQGSEENGIGSHAEDADSQVIISKLPLVNKLPYSNTYYPFEIDDGQSLKHPNVSTDIAIYVSYVNNVGKQAAIQWLIQKGYPPSKLEIYYLDDPLLTALPYNTLSYNLTGGFQIVNNKPIYVVNALVLLNQAESGDPSAAAAGYEQQIQSYIQSTGVSSSDYTINYQVSGG
jgi:hypothetical protein